MKGLDTAERLTLLVLMSYKGKDGLICPSLRTISTATGLSLSWQWRIIKKLNKERKIKIIKRKGKYNTYEMLF
jgi:DNA-binding Lrp family transcriptional regulator